MPRPPFWFSGRNEIFSQEGQPKVYLGKDCTCYGAGRFQNLKLKLNHGFLLCLTSVIGAIVVYVYLYGLTNEDGVIQLRLKEEVTNLRKQFPTQPRETWVKISTALRPVMLANPQQPAVLLFLSTPETYGTTRRLVTNLSAAAKNLMGTSVRQSSSIIGFHFAEGSRANDFYSTAIQYLDSDKVLIIEDINNLCGEAAMFFHALADHKMAPVKRSVIILTVHISHDFKDGTSLTKLVSDHLKECWEMKYEAISGILSRILVFPLRVLPEETSKD